MSDTVTAPSPTDIADNLKVQIDSAICPDKSTKDSPEDVTKDSARFDVKVDERVKPVKDFIVVDGTPV